MLLTQTRDERDLHTSLTAQYPGEILRPRCLRNLSRCWLFHDGLTDCLPLNAVLTDISRRFFVKYPLIFEQMIK